MERSNRARIASLRDAAAAAILAAFGASCAATADESGRPCPCLDGYVCCAGVCVPQGGGCTDSANAGGSEAGASAEDAKSSSDATNGEAAPDAPAPLSDAGFLDAGTTDVAMREADTPEAAALDASSPEAAMSCPSLPPPRVHFPFADCSDAGLIRDIAGGATGTIEGSGVHCDQSPVGSALRFDGVDDAGIGSYLRVADSVEASAPGCGEAGSCPPDWSFGSAITISALIDVANTGSYENILGQWYYGDSYIFNTFYDPTLSQQVFRFSVQPTGAPQPANVSTPLLLAGGQPGSAWSHWVGVFDGASMTLYRDGQVVSTQMLDAGGALQCTSVPLELGVVGRQGPCADLNESYFTGAIGDFQVFDVALSAAQVQALECSLGWPPAPAPHAVR
jgi:hypothetical protein